MVQRKAETAIVIPTFNSSNVTTFLLKKLELQSDVKFDVIVIDAGKSKDYKVLNNLATNLNIIIKHLKFDEGSAGSFYNGEKIAYTMGYKYIILTDNDAIPISKNLIKALVSQCGPKVAVVPSNIFIHKRGTGAEYVEHYPFHFLTLHRDMISKLNFVKKELFTFGDDLEYTKRISNTFRLKRMRNLFYSHRAGIEIFLMELLKFRSFYYGIRNNILIEEKLTKKITIAISYLILFFPLSLKINKRNFFKFNRVLFKAVLDGVKGKTGRASIITSNFGDTRFVQISKNKILIKGCFLIGSGNEKKITGFDIFKLLISNKKVIVDNNVEAQISYRILPFLYANRLYLAKNKHVYKPIIF